MFEKELEIALLACKEAMKNIMKYYNAGFHVEIKSDESPVTEADKTSDVLIKEIISKEFPNYSFLTEESDDDLSISLDLLGYTESLTFACACNDLSEFLKNKCKESR